MAEPALPPAYWLRVAAQLGPQAQAYRAALAQPAPVTLRLNPARVDPSHVDTSRAPLEVLAGAQPLPIAQAYALTQRPAFVLDPAWHAGAYYVQEYSSMHVAHCLAECLEQALEPHRRGRPLRVLDRCAAPGGKATHLAALLPPGSLLVACEPVPTRRSILIENLDRWGLADALVQAEPLGWAPGAFDAIVVDAPCSGEGLFRRQPEAVGEWSEAAVSACAARQADILDRTLPLLAPGGLLAYSTCTAAPDENAAQVARLLARHPHLAVLPLPALEAAGWLPQSLPQALTQAPGALLGYQAWPHRTAGEGLFLALLRHTGPAAQGPSGPSRQLPAQVELPRQAPLPLEAWLAPPVGWQLLLHRGQPAVLSASAYELLRQGLAQPQLMTAARLGLPLGQVVAGARKAPDFTPSQALALSPHLSPALPRLALGREAALRYLKREAFAPEAPPAQPGWHLATYQGLPLGGVKAIAAAGGFRLNNYLPPAWRIRRDIPL